jgi:hypothetical protein
MFKLTKQEQMLVALLVGAIMLGTVVREWRARQASQSQPGVAALGKAH